VHIIYKMIVDLIYEDCHCILAVTWTLRADALDFVCAEVFSAALSAMQTLFFLLYVPQCMFRVRLA